MSKKTFTKYACATQESPRAWPFRLLNRALNNQRRLVQFWSNFLAGRLPHLPVKNDRFQPKNPVKSTTYADNALLKTGNNHRPILVQFWSNSRAQRESRSVEDLALAVLRSRLRIRKVSTIRQRTTSGNWSKKGPIFKRPDWARSSFSCPSGFRGEYRFLRDIQLGIARPMSL